MDSHRANVRSAALRTGTSSHPMRVTALYRPQTNGKIERFHRTLAGGWAYARP